MKRYRRVAGMVASLGAVAIGLGIVTASPALAGPAGQDLEVDYLRFLENNGVDITRANVDEAIELGYSICALRQVGPQYLNPTSVPLVGSVKYLCSSMEPSGPTPEGRLALANAQADLARIQNRMSGVNLGYIYHD